MISGLKIKGLVSDRCVSITKLMREQFPDIEHHLDVWHISKGLKMKLFELARTKSEFKKQLEPPYVLAC